MLQRKEFRHYLLITSFAGSNALCNFPLHLTNSSSLHTDRHSKKMYLSGIWRLRHHRKNKEENGACGKSNMPKGHFRPSIMMDFPSCSAVFFILDSFHVVSPSVIIRAHKYRKFLPISSMSNNLYEYDIFIINATQSSSSLANLSSFFLYVLLATRSHNTTSCLYHQHIISATE